MPKAQKRDPPWLILHRAGEDATRLRAGLASAADFVEIDVWSEDGRAACRHDPLLIAGWPYLTRRYGLPWPRLRRLWLDEVEAAGRVFLDFKDPRPAVVDEAVGGLRRSGSLAGAIASTPMWSLLDHLAELAPTVGRFYSIGRGATGSAAWERYRERMGTEAAGWGVSIHQASADAERLAALRGAGLRAICYTVNDEARGVELVEQGAGGLTSDRLDLISRWRDRWGSRE